MCGASSLVLFAAVYCYLCTVLFVVIVVKLNSSIIHRLGINVLCCICLICLLQVKKKRNRGRRLENDQITHIQIRNGKVKCQQNICACVCSHSVAKRGVYCCRWQRCQADVTVDIFIFLYFEKFKVANWVLNQCININKYIYIHLYKYLCTHIYMHIYVCMAKRCPFETTMQQLAVLPCVRRVAILVLLFFVLFFLLIAISSQTKKGITKNLIKLCALYLYTYRYIYEYIVYT